MVTHCDFGVYLDQALQNRLVCGICHQGMQKRLLSEAKLTLFKTTEIAQSVEAAETQASQFKETSNAPVMVVKPQVYNQQYGVCTHCGGYNYQSKDCRYKEAVCHKCHKPGHLARMYRSKTTKAHTPHQFVQPNNHVRETVDSEMSDGTLFHVVQETPSRPFNCVEGRTLSFEVDTGATVTLISEAT